MRNLKRALSLALAAIMLIGMMVVSASAVSYNDLTDKDQIVNKDAVSMLVSQMCIRDRSGEAAWPAFPAHHHSGRAGECVPPVYPGAG